MKLKNVSWYFISPQLNNHTYPFKTMISQFYEQKLFIHLPSTMKIHQKHIENDSKHSFHTPE